MPRRPQDRLMKRTNHVASRLRGFSSGASLGGKVSRYRDKQNIYKQGTPAYTLFYIQEGGVRLTPALRPLYCPYAGAKHPRRGGPGRPALQLHRETPGLLARYGAQGHPQSVLPKVSQKTLASSNTTARSASTIPSSVSSCTTDATAHTFQRPQFSAPCRCDDRCGLV